MTLNELGGKRKFVVIKIEDLIKYVKSPFKLAMLDNDLEDIRKGRESDGKNPVNEYLVVNLDEPYAPEIIEIMKRNGHWGDSTAATVELETCNGCENEYNPRISGGIVNGHPFCQKCLEGMAEQSARVEEAIELLKEFAFYCVDATPLEHCNQAVKVQEFLKTTYAREWLEDKFEEDRIQDLINEAPDECPITGCRKCESYIIGGNVVYLTDPAYDAYTLPEYDEEEQAFSRTHYDLDDNNNEDYEYLCSLEDLKGREDFEDIKSFYGIK